MISANEARKLTESNSELQPILEGIENEILNATLRGKFKTKIEIPIEKFNMVCKVLGNYGYTCDPYYRKNIGATRLTNSSTIVSWEEPNKIKVIR